MLNFFSFDAMQILWFCPSNNKHYEIFRLGYNQQCAHSLENDYMKIYPPGFTKIMSNDLLPVSISDSSDMMNPPFRETEIFTQHLNKFGFNDGLTLELNSADHHLGVLHLSSKKSNTFNLSMRLMINNFKVTLESWLKSQISFKLDRTHSIFLRDTHYEMIKGEPELCEIFIKNNLNFLDNAVKVNFLSIIKNNIYKVDLSTLPNHAKIINISPYDNKYNLSRKEIIVLSWLMIGYSDKEISSATGIGQRTVNTHVTALFRKLKTKNRVEAALFAALNNLNIIDHDLIILDKIKKFQS